jgi:hypothetical protein
MTEEKRQSPKVVNFQCDDCNYSYGELFMPNEDIPHMLVQVKCVNCGGILRKRDFKNNSQRVFVNDPQR